MNRAFLWSAALMALTAVTAQAQTPLRVEPPSPKPTRDMQEDIEIMRRLLDDAFAKTYGFSLHGPLTSPIRYYPMIGPAQLSDDGRLVPAQHINSAAPHAEGVYLKDYGVVYTVTLPSTGFDPLPASKPGSGGNAPPDDWDRIRKEIRGETPTPENKVLPAHQPLSEVILKVLADNGKHFTGLADGERISVAVTFRGAANCTNCHQNPWEKGQPGSPALGNQWQDLPNGSYAYWTATSTGGTPAGAGSPSQTQAQTAAAAWLTDVHNTILLGDLHMKQGKTQEAIAAYQKAMEQAAQSLPASASKEDQVAVLLTAVDVYNKLAAAYVRAGNSDSEASAALKKASELAKKAEDLTGGAVTANPAPGAPAAALPAKLIVTASTKQLNDMAAGKMTFEMFCQAATVEYVNPPAEKR